MTVYTGNDGRMYIGRVNNTGLAPTITGVVPNGESVTADQVYAVITIAGSGRNGAVRALNSVSPSATSRTATFQTVDPGWGYAVGNVVFIQGSRGGAPIRVTNNITLGEVETAGVENYWDILEESKRVAKIRGWTLNSSSEIVETTSIGDIAKTYVPSVVSGDGSATLMFYEDDLGLEGRADIYEVIDLLFPRSVPQEVFMSLMVSGGTFTGDGGDLWKTNFSFRAFITSASIGISYGEVVTVETNFTVNGSLIDLPWKPGRITV